MIANEDLPSGLVSFVFTDIEGSTRLLRRLGDHYDDVLEHHRSLLRQTWSQFDGHEISTSGDSFFVAFADATAAVSACAQAQSLLRGATWPEGAEVKVRMGVHTGLASPRDRDYVSLAVHQAARVMAAGHGGQVLATDDTVAELGALDSAELTPLGRFRLRDFDEPVQLYAVYGPGYPRVTRAVRALPADRHNLPRPSDAFVGRVTEIAGVASRVRPGGLLTLVGPGGVGKTRLAVETGLGLTTEWRDGIWLVDLGSLGEPTLVPAAVADALGVGVDADHDARESLLASIETSALLILLDNCDHLLGACADLVVAILGRSRNVGVLATSRTPLGVRGEGIYRVGPLGLPAHDAPVAEVRNAPAVQLLVDRVAAHGRRLEIEPETAAGIAELCVQLDGLPLALELAAARLDLMTPAELADRLKRGLSTLASRERDRPERQQSLSNLLDWSYETLSEEEQSALRRLSIFGASFSLEAAMRAISGQPSDDLAAAELLYSLADKSLVVPDLRANDTRYHMLETVRDYGRTRLSSDEADAVSLTLSDWLLDTVGPWLPRDRRWLGELEIELDNIRPLIERLAVIDVERAQLLACSVGRHHDVAHNFRVGIEELTRWSELLSEPGPIRRVLLATLADLHLRVGETDAARSVLAPLETEDGAAAELPDWDDAAVERSRGDVLLRAGELQAALRITETAIAGSLSVRGRARMWNLAGITAIAAGELERAARAFREELALNESLEDIVPIAAGHGNLAEVALRRGERVDAAREQLASLRLALELGLPVMVAYSLIVSARLGIELDARAAVELHSNAERILQETGATLYPADHQLSEAMLDEARGLLGSTAFEAAYQAGAARPVTVAIEQAVGVLEGVLGAAQPSAPSGGAT